MAAASTNNSASRPMVPRGWSPWQVGLCVGQGGTGCPRHAVATVEPERVQSDLAIDRTARDWALDYERIYGKPRSAPRSAPAAVTPYDFSTSADESKTVVHESILRIAGARRATAAARRRTIGAFLVEARASSVVTLDARRPRSGTPHPHHLMAAPSGPRRACGSCARTASRPVDSSGPSCTY